MDQERVRLILILQSLVKKDKSNYRTYSKDLLKYLVEKDIINAKIIAKSWLSSLSELPNDIKIGFPQTKSAKQICEICEAILKLN